MKFFYTNIISCQSLIPDIWPSEIIWKNSPVINTSKCLDMDWSVKSKQLKSVYFTQKSQNTFADWQNHISLTYSDKGLSVSILKSQNHVWGTNSKSSEPVPFQS